MTTLSSASARQREADGQGMTAFAEYTEYIKPTPTPSRTAACLRQCNMLPSFRVSNLKKMHIKISGGLRLGFLRISSTKGLSNLRLENKSGMPALYDIHWTYVAVRNVCKQDCSKGGPLRVQPHCAIRYLVFIVVKSMALRAPAPHQEPSPMLGQVTNRAHAGCTAWIKF